MRLFITHLSTFPNEGETSDDFIYSCLSSSGIMKPDTLVGSSFFDDGSLSYKINYDPKTMFLRATSQGDAMT